MSLVFAWVIVGYVISMILVGLWHIRFFVFEMLFMSAVCVLIAWAFLKVGMGA